MGRPRPCRGAAGGVPRNARPEGGRPATVADVPSRGCASGSKVAVLAVAAGRPVTVAP